MKARNIKVGQVIKVENSVIVVRDIKNDNSYTYINHSTYILSNSEDVELIEDWWETLFILLLYYLRVELPGATPLPKCKKVEIVGTIFV